MNEKQDRIAKQLSRAYWRGRLECSRTTYRDDGIFEHMIDAAGDAGFEEWRQTAMLLVDEKNPASDGEPTSNQV